MKLNKPFLYLSLVVFFISANDLFSYYVEKELPQELRSVLDPDLLDDSAYPFGADLQLYFNSVTERIHAEAYIYDHNNSTTIFHKYYIFDADAELYNVIDILDITSTIDPIVDFTDSAGVPLGQRGVKLEDVYYSYNIFPSNGLIRLDATWRANEDRISPLVRNSYVFYLTEDTDSSGIFDLMKYKVDSLSSQNLDQNFYSLTSGYSSDQTDLIAYVSNDYKLVIRDPKQLIVPYAPKQVLATDNFNIGIIEWSGYYYIDTENGEIAITNDLGEHLYEGIYGPWKPQCIEPDIESGGFKLLWSDEKGEYIVWDLDLNGKESSSQYVSNIQNYESLFSQDIDKDGYTGEVPDIYTAVYTDEQGEGIVKSVRTGHYFIQSDLGARSPVTENGIHLYEGIYGLWKPIYADDDDNGDFIVYWSDGGEIYVIYILNADGVFKDIVYDPDLFFDEIDRGDDINGDSYIGDPRYKLSADSSVSFIDVAVNENGEGVVKNNIGYYYVQTYQGIRSPITEDGRVLYEGIYGDWVPVYAFAEYSDEFSVYWSNGNGDYVLYYLDSSGAYQSLYVIDNIFAEEILVEEDINEDGVIGYSSYIEISVNEDGKGIVQSEYGGYYFLQSSPYFVKPIIENGTHLYQGIYGDWTPFYTYEEIGGDTRLYWHDGKSSYIIYILNSDGEKTSFIEVSDIYYEESGIQVDLNGDGIVGDPRYQSGSGGESGSGGYNGYTDYDVEFTTRSLVDSTYFDGAMLRIAPNNDYYLDRNSGSTLSSSEVGYILPLMENSKIVNFSSHDPWQPIAVKLINKSDPENSNYELIWGDGYGNFAEWIVDNYGRKLSGSDVFQDISYHENFYDRDLNGDFYIGSVNGSTGFVGKQYEMTLTNPTLLEYLDSAQQNVYVAHDNFIINGINGNFVDTDMINIVGDKVYDTDLDYWEFYFDTPTSGRFQLYWWDGSWDYDYSNPPTSYIANPYELGTFKEVEVSIRPKYHRSPINETFDNTSNYWQSGEYFDSVGIKTADFIVNNSKLNFIASPDDIAYELEKDLQYLKTLKMEQEWTITINDIVLPPWQEELTTGIEIELFDYKNSNTVELELFMQDTGVNSYGDPSNVDSNKYGSFLWAEGTRATGDQYLFSNEGVWNNIGLLDAGSKVSWKIENLPDQEIIKIYKNFGQGFEHSLTYNSNSGTISGPDANSYNSSVSDLVIFSPQHTVANFKIFVETEDQINLGELTIGSISVE